MMWLQVNLTSDQLSKLKVRDGRVCRDHLADLSTQLEDTIELSEGIFRRYEEATQCHVANYMYEIGGYCFHTIHCIVVASNSCGICSKEK